MDYRVITRDFQVVTGEQAKHHLSIMNDREFLSADSGVIAVTRERWNLAQDAEANGWMTIWRDAVEDRNAHHYALFDYLSIFGQHTFRKALEIGCGPFTNLRIFLMSLRIETIELLDPLIKTYLDHPHCSYRDNSLLLSDGTRKPIAALHPLPVEDLQGTASFDLVILINVIEHCIDVRKVFANVWDILEPGGVFIFHDKYFEHAKVASEVESIYDTAHPLKIDQRVIDDFLGRFRMLFSRQVTTAGAAPMTGEGRAVYFIGQKPR